MIVRNKLTNTKPAVFHAPGPKHDQKLYLEQNPFWPVLKSTYFQSSTSIPNPNIGIVTWNNKPNKEVLALCLDRCNIPYVCKGAGVVWDNTKKIALAIEALQNVEQEITLMADCNDVLIVSSLLPAVEFLRRSRFDYLVNAEKEFWPKIGGLSADWQASQSSNVGLYKYFNAGVILGRTQALLEYYRALDKVQVRLEDFDGSLPPRSILRSEQVRHHYVYEEYKSRIWLDTNAEFFQVIVHHAADDFSIAPIL